MNLKLVDSLDIKVWRDYVDHHPQGNIFHTPEMYQVFEQTRGYHPLLYAAVDGESQVQALLPLAQITLMKGLLRLFTTRAIAYGGLLSTPNNAGREALTALLNAYSAKVARKVLFTDLRNLSDMSLLQPVFSACGFAFEEHLDYLIDLHCSPDQLLRRIGSRTRQHIRRGLRKGNVIVEQVADTKQLTIWYDLLKKTYHAARIPLADPSLFEAAYKILQPQGMVVFWLARIGSAYVAASAELLYKDVIHGWYGGVDRTYTKDTPGELLMWHILEWGAVNGYKTYDFGGAGKPGEEYGVRDFKAKFGGQLVCFGRNKKIHSRHLLSWSEWGFQIYQNFLKRLPV